MTAMVAAHVNSLFLRTRRGRFSAFYSDRALSAVHLTAFAAALNEEFPPHGHVSWQLIKFERTTGKTGIRLFALTVSNSVPSPTNLLPITTVPIQMCDVEAHREHELTTDGLSYDRSHSRHISSHCGGLAAQRVSFCSVQFAPPILSFSAKTNYILVNQMFEGDSQSSQPQSTKV